MSMIRTLWQCCLSPRLFKIYEIQRIGPGRIVDRPYEPYSLERWGDQIVVTFATMWSIRFYAIPLLLSTLLYRRGSLMVDAYALSKFIFGASVVLIVSIVVRGYSRATNPTYMKFVKVLEDANARLNFETKQEMQKYEFEYWAWPVEFKAIPQKSAEQTASERNSGNRFRRLGNKDRLFAVPCKVASYITAHTVAITLIYPGCISLINWMIGTTLLQGRIDLIKQGAERYKLKTGDGNEIDAIFLDRRQNSMNGEILVIACEGNCGFYEAGIISTPISKGYSVVGWNHPGFGNSTGAPYPSQEQNGIDCVLQFALNKLGFAEEKIMIYGWSIGGYTATYAAMNYPNIYSLILDATFDDILPLAVPRMPMLLENLVRNVIREYFNLNIAEQLNRYTGRVLIIRRTEDEIICAPTMNLEGNRGNHLLNKLLAKRYPNIFQENETIMLLNKFLIASTDFSRRSIMETIGVNEKECMELIAKDIRDNGNVVKYPSNLGEKCTLLVKNRLVLFLATKYLEDQCTQHCAPLALELFHPGWDPMSTLNA